MSGTKSNLVRAVSPPRLQNVTWSAVTCNTIVRLTVCKVLLKVFLPPNFSKWKQLTVGYKEANKKVSITQNEFLIVFNFRLKISLPKILLIYFPTHPLTRLSKRCLENLRFQDPAQFAQWSLHWPYTIGWPGTRSLWLQLAIEIFDNFLKPVDTNEHWVAEMDHW